MTRPGYTDRQAFRLIERLDRRLARVEDALGELHRTVTDHDEHPHGPMEVARDTANRLAAIVARRLRRPMRPEIVRLGLVAISDELGHRIESERQRG